MDVKALKTVRFERYLFGVLMALSMVWLSELSGEKEIIFPEICALTIGAWICEQQPWAVNKRRIFLLMSAAALFGVLVVRYCHFALIWQVYFACLFKNYKLYLSCGCYDYGIDCYFCSMGYGKKSFKAGE